MDEHSTRAHARLGPSGASQWISCPGSVLLVESLGIEDTSSVYADEGTAAHELGEIRAAYRFGMINVTEEAERYSGWLKRWERFTSDPEWVADCNRHVLGYVDLLQEEFDRVPGSTIMLERRVDAGVPESDGTSDAIILSPVHITSVDLKYGAGVKVYAAGNPQLRLYGAGALREFGDLLGETKTVRCVVFQPRMDHIDAEEIDADELREWVETIVVPAAIEALSPGARFAPSEETCRWCDASGRCPAQMEKVFAVPFEEPTTLAPGEIAEALQRAPFIKQWLSSLEAAALTMAYEEEKDIPGYKVVQSGGVRQIKDQEGALSALDAVGFTRDQTVNPGKIKGIGDLEKLMGKREFATLLAPYIKKTEGRPSLAPKDDPRPAINIHKEAASAFSDKEIEE